MGTKTLKCCDVYGTVNAVRTYEVTVKEVDENGATVMHEHTLDLCGRGLDRLLHFVNRGCNPAKRKGKQE